MTAWLAQVNLHNFLTISGGTQYQNVLVGGENYQTADKQLNLNEMQNGTSFTEPSKKNNFKADNF